MTEENKPLKIESLDEVVVEACARITIGDSVGPSYPEIEEKILIDGKLIYTAKKELGKWIVNFDGKESKEYFWVGNLMNINGKLVYKASKENGKKQVVVFDGKEESEYTSIYTLENMNGKRVYSARKDNYKVVVVIDGVEGPEFYSIKNLRELGGKPIYEAGSSCGDKTTIIFDEKEISKKEYETLKKLFEG